MSNQSDQKRGLTTGEEEDLIRRTIAGEVEAYGDLVAKYQQRIFNLVTRMVGRREAVEDLVQEVFIKAFRKIRSFRFESAFYTWLYAIALNTCRNYYRRPEAAYRDVALEEHSGLVEKAAPSETPDEVAIRRQRAELVREALDRLIPEQKEALIMCDLEGLSYQEIADVLGVPIGTVRSRIFRARAGMKELLPAEMGEG